MFFENMELVDNKELTLWPVMCNDRSCVIYLKFVWSLRCCSATYLRVQIHQRFLSSLQWLKFQLNNSCSVIFLDFSNWHSSDFINRMGTFQPYSYSIIIVHNNRNIILIDVIIDEMVPRSWFTLIIIRKNYDYYTSQLKKCCLLYTSDAADE